jgi:hypothetical protein
MRKVLPKKTVKRKKKPRFPYLMAALAYIAWAGWGYMLFFVPPNTVVRKLLFLAAFFFAFLFTLIFLFYEVGRLINPGDLPSGALQTSGRRALFTAAFLSLAGALKLLGVGSLLNLTLFGLILLLIEVHLSTGKDRPKEKGRN